MSIKLPKSGKDQVTEDLEATLVNALAAVADLLSHYQDLIARENYLDTAGQRTSTRSRQRVAAEFRRRLEKIRELLMQLEKITGDK